MKYYDEYRQELRDVEIVRALRKAADDYENGAIIEVYDTLIEICQAIDYFEEQEGT